MITEEIVRDFCHRKYVTISVPDNDDYDWVTAMVSEWAYYEIGEPFYMFYYKEFREETPMVMFSWKPFNIFHGMEGGN